MKIFLILILAFFTKLSFADNNLEQIWAKLTAEEYLSEYFTDIKAHEQLLRQNNTPDIIVRYFIHRNVTTLLEQARQRGMQEEQIQKALLGFNLKPLSEEEERFLKTNYPHVIATMTTHKSLVPNTQHIGQQTVQDVIESLSTFSVFIDTIEQIIKRNISVNQVEALIKVLNFRDKGDTSNMWFSNYTKSQLNETVETLYHVGFTIDEISIIAKTIPTNLTDLKIALQHMLLFSGDTAFIELAIKAKDLLRIVKTKLNRELTTNESVAIWGGLVITFKLLNNKSPTKWVNFTRSQLRRQAYVLKKYGQFTKQDRREIINSSCKKAFSATPSILSL